MLRLRILQTSDLHGALRGFDYLADEPSHVMGLSRTATLIRTARAQAANSLLFDCGDFLQGSPVCDFAAERAHDRCDATHPMIAAMNTLDYDAATIGNHDFNHGADFLFDTLEKASFPIVSANFLDAVNTDDTGGPIFNPFIRLNRELTDKNGKPCDITIAVIGCLPPQSLAWDHSLSGRFTVTDMVQSVREQAALARASGADLVIVLAHTGIDPKAPAQNAENALIALAALDDVDVVLGGHTHMVFPSCAAPTHPAIDAVRGLIHGKPVLMPGFWGNHLGQLDLDLARDDTGAWRLTGSRAKALPLSRRDANGQMIHTTSEDPNLLTTTEEDHRATLRHIRQPAGETATSLHSFFSLVANDAAVQLVAEAQSDYLAYAIKNTALDGLPILSSAAPLKTGRRSGPQHYTHIPVGPLTRRSLADLYYYPNTLCALHLSGARLCDWLEHSAGLFNQITPGQNANTPLLNEHFPGYQFEVICGLTYEIDLSKPPRFNAKFTLANPQARRIRNLRWQGRPVHDNDEFLLATNSFRAYGIGLDLFAPDNSPSPEIVYEASLSSRSILLDFIRRSSPLKRTVQRVWSFAPMQGATAWFDTAPQARAYLDDPVLPPLQDLGDTPKGFARFQITL